MRPKKWGTPECIKAEKSTKCTNLTLPWVLESTMQKNPNLAVNDKTWKNQTLFIIENNWGKKKKSHSLSKIPNEEEINLKLEEERISLKERALCYIDDLRISNVLSFLVIFSLIWFLYFENVLNRTASYRFDPDS